MIETFADVVDIITNITDKEENWHDKNISGPNSDCIKSTYIVLTKLYDDYSILPQYVRRSYEGGITLEFFSISNHVLMDLYNDGDCSIVFKSDSMIRDSMDLNNEERKRLSPQIIYLMLKS